jgi:hypothetical protein
VLQQRWSISLSRVMYVLLFVSVAINALQARKILDLVEPAASTRSRIGELASPLTGVGLDGRAKSIHFRTALPTVLYYFSPTCGWCERNWENMRALARASNGHFRLVGIATDTNLASFASERELDFELLGGISSDVKIELGLSGTPQMLVVSSQGRISREWTGAFEGRRKRSIEDFFDIELPGVQPASKATIRR